MSVPRIALRNFAVMFAGNVVGQLAFFGGLIQLAHVLGPANFGIWNFAQAWLLYLFRAGELGLELLGIREIARFPQDTSKWLKAVVVLRLAMSLVLFLATLVAVMFGMFPPGAGTLVALFSVSVFPMALVLDWVLEAHQKIEFVAVSRIAKGGLFLVLILIFVKDGTEVTASVIAYVVSVLLPILAMFLYTVNRYGWSHQPFNFTEGIDTLREAFPIGLSSLLLQLGMSLGTFVIGFWMAPVALGYYTASQRLVVFIWAYVVSSSWRIMLPVLSGLHRSSQEEFKNVILKSLRLISIVAMPIGIAVVVSGEEIIGTLYAAEYFPAAPVFKVLIWSLVLGIVRAILEIGIVASDNQRRWLFGVVLLTVCYLVMTPVLVSTSGIIGAAVASVIAEFIYSVFVFFSLPNVGFVLVIAQIWRPLLGCSLIVGFNITFPMDVWWDRVLVSLLSYLGWLFVSKALSLSDMRFLSTSIRSIFTVRPS